MCGAVVAGGRDGVYHQRGGDGQYVAGCAEGVGRGLETRQVAEELRLGIKTVESYRARIREKLQLADGGQLLQHASQWVGKPCQGGTQP